MSNVESVFQKKKTFQTLSSSAFFAPTCLTVPPRGDNLWRASAASPPPALRPAHTFGLAASRAHRAGDACGVPGSGRLILKSSDPDPHPQRYLRAWFGVQTNPCYRGFGPYLGGFKRILLGVGPPMYLSYPLGAGSGRWKSEKRSSWLGKRPAANHESEQMKIDCGHLKTLALRDLYTYANCCHSTNPLRSSNLPRHAVSPSLPVPQSCP